MKFTLLAATTTLRILSVTPGAISAEPKLRGTGDTTSVFKEQAIQAVKRKSKIVPPGHEQHMGRNNTEGCPVFSFPEHGAAPAYTAQDGDTFEPVSCDANDKVCDVPSDGNQGLHKDVFEPCLEDIAPPEMTCMEVAESWTEDCMNPDDTTLLDDEFFTCGCMSNLIQDGTYCQRTCGQCSPVFVNREGFRSGTHKDLDLERGSNLAHGISMYQKALPRIPCERYDVGAVADAVRAMHVPDMDGTLDIPPTVRAGFHDAADFNKWSGTGGADGRLYNNAESWYGQSRTLNQGLLCAMNLMGKFDDTSLSPGDAIQICSMVAVEVAGGPLFEDFNFEAGRISASGVSQDGLLPLPLGNNVMLRDFFYRAALDDVDIVALSGAHTLGGGQGQAGSGFEGDFTPTPEDFSNDYYQQLVKYESVTTSNCDYFAEGMTPEDRASTGCTPIESVMQLPTDRALMLDSSFRDLVIKFANDKQAFFDQYAKSVKKMSELGRDISVQWCDYDL